MKFIFEAIFLGLMGAIADTQARMIGENKPIRHFWWGCLFGALIIYAWWLEDRSYWFAGALVVEHFVYFSPMLNFFRSPRRAFFYLDSQPKSGALWDKVLLQVEKYYPFIWATALVGWIALQFKL